MKKSIVRTVAILSLAAMLGFSGCQPSQPAGGSTDTNSTESVVTGDVNSTGASSTDTNSVGSTIGGEVSSQPGSSSQLGSSSQPGVISRPGGSSQAGSVSSVSQGSSTSTVTSSSTTSTGNSSRPVSPSSSNTPQPEPDGYVQKQFYIATWRAVNFGAEEAKYTKVIKANKEAGINLIENAVLGLNEVEMAARICNEQGVDFMVSNIAAVGGFTGMGISDVAQKLDDKLVQTYVKKFGSYEHLIGYYVWDEVPRDQYDVCRKNIALFEKYDPKRLAFTLLFPSYGTYKWHFPAGCTPETSDYYKYVTDYVKQVDPPVLSMDYYALKDANTSLLVNSLWMDMGVFRKESIRTGKPFWWYFQGYDMADGTVGHMTRAKLAVQMFAGVAYGCKTLSYFQSLGVITDEFGNKTTLYDGAKSLNAEVQNLGDLLFNKKSSELYHFGVSDKLKNAYFLDDVSKSSIIKSAPDGTIVSVFTDNTKAKYVMVVNKDYKNAVKGNLTLKKSSTVEEYNKTTNKFSTLRSGATTVEMNLKPGDCVLYRIG